MSLFRVFSGTFVLLIALVIGLSVWFWPRLSDLDTYRPRITALLSQAAQRPLTIGHLKARLFPQPGLIARDVTIFYRDHAERPLLTASRVSLRFHTAALWNKELRPRIIVFTQPRLFLARETTSWTTVGDLAPSLSTVTLASVSVSTASTSNAYPVERIEINNGVITLHDQMVIPEYRHDIEQVNGTFDPVHKKGEFTGLSPTWGSPARFTVTVNEQASYPIDLMLENVRLQSFRAYFPTMAEWLSGSVSLHLKAKTLTMMAFEIQRLTLNKFPGLMGKGKGQIHGKILNSDFQVAGTTTPVRGAFHAMLQSDPLDIDGSYSNYTPEIAMLISTNSWITRLEGPGHGRFAVHRSQAEHLLNWKVDGENFGFSGTPFDIRQLHLSGTMQTVDVQVDLKTRGGDAQVHWVKNLNKPTSALEVTASSVSVQDIFAVFNRRLAPVKESTGTFRAQAWQDLSFSQVHLTAGVTPHKSFIIHRAVLTLDHAQARGSGIFGLQGGDAPAHLEGHLHHLAIESLLARFFKTRPSMTGTANVDFNLDFPLRPMWFESLNGTLHVHAVKGVVRSFKTLYDVLSVLNMTTYLTLHLPHFQEEGIPYDSLTGHFTVADGVFSTQDAFMKTPDSNIGIEGVVDIPGQEIDATLRVQFFRLIEDVIRNIPGLKWIFNDKHKILLPIVVNIRGPWKKVEVE